MNIKKFSLAVILVWLIGMGIGFALCGWLFNWVYYLPPIIWKTPKEVTEISNMIGSQFFSLIQAFAFVLFFVIVYNSIPKTGVKKGLVYGLLVWFVGALPGIASMYFYMTISKTVVIYWVIQALLIALINGAVIGYIYKKTS